MARHNLSWRLASATLAILIATAWTADNALAQYTFVQDTDSVGDWSDVANWLDGGSNTTYPNGIGVTAQINQPIKSGVGGYTLDMPTTDVTVGQLTIDNTGDFYATRITMVNHAPGRLIFEDSSGTAKFIETANNTPGDAPGGVQNSIQVLIQLNSDLEITQDNYPNLNTGTIFTNRIDGDASRTIIKKGLGGIQFNLNVAPPLGPGEGFFGQILIQEGAIRLINRTTFLSTVSGVTVSDGGQLQLADNNAVPVPDYNMADGAVLNLNGVGTNAPSSGPEGALRFGIVAGRTATFHNPVVLQSDSVISVGAATSIGVINQPVSGTGSLTKQGGGTLVLSNAANSYSGDTTLLAGGPLSITNPFLSDLADVYLTTGSIFDLSFAGTDTIRSLYVDGAPQPEGVYGSADLGGLLITGSGTLTVTEEPGVGLDGDHNGDGFVDAADYVIWRKSPGDFGGDPDGYNDFVTHFGETEAGSGGSQSPVPEPNAIVVAAFAVCGLLTARRLKLVAGAR